MEEKQGEYKYCQGSSVRDLARGTVGIATRCRIPLPIRFGRSCSWLLRLSADEAYDQRQIINARALEVEEVEEF